jgi:NAD(P)-dependent dehydrogenase (short-subunit alcohol dehydrogenase family)
VAGGAPANPQPDRGFVLITGARSGIGRATALHLDSLGYRVIATDLPGTDAGSLAREGSDRMNAFDLDVTDSASIEAAAAQTAELTGGRGLHGLVNNAGIAVGGPLEVLPLDDVRLQFEVNTFGPLAVTNALLPELRKGPGRVVNVTSLSGRIGAPFVGAYSASKHALEGISAALRIELRPWGIPVSTIEPGFMKTGIYNASQLRFEKFREGLREGALDNYAEILERQPENLKELERRALSPTRVAKKIAKALAADTPKARYLVGPDAWALVALHTLFGPRAQERIGMTLMRAPERWRKGGPPPPGSSAA